MVDRNPPTIYGRKEFSKCEMVSEWIEYRDKNGFVPSPDFGAENRADAEEYVATLD